ncbi:unnamed protein product, partial [Allacma fusca]
NLSYIHSWNSQAVTVVVSEVKGNQN